jgi:hypothetical protein
MRKNAYKSGGKYHLSNHFFTNPDLTPSPLGSVFSKHCNRVEFKVEANKAGYFRLYLELK